MFSSDYPKLTQWMTYGGKFYIRPEPEGRLVAAFGDAGGFPYQSPIAADTLDDLMDLAEAQAADLIESHRELLDTILADGLPELHHQEFISVPGNPPVKNPHYLPPR